MWTQFQPYQIPVYIIRKSPQTKKQPQKNETGKLLLYYEAFHLLVKINEMNCELFIIKTTKKIIWETVD